MTLSTDAICFARDATGSIVVPLRVARGGEAVFIMLRHALTTWRDEWFLDRRRGLPYLETPDGFVSASEAILGQPYDAARIASIVRPVVLGVPGVTGIRELSSSSPESRAISIRVVAFSVFGDVTVDISA